MSFLSSKEQARLNKVREALKNNVNPYSEISSLVLGSGEFIDGKQTINKELTPDQRREKFNNTIGKTSWMIIDGDADIQPMDDTKVSCMICKANTDHTTVVYGRVITNTFKKVIEGVRDDHGTMVEYRAVISIPVYAKGWVCNDCSDRLYLDKYYDRDGNVHHGIEYLDAPVFKVKETFRKGKRSVTHTVPYKRSESLSRPDKDEVIDVVEVVKETDDYIEEWDIKKTPVDEPVDVRAYNKFVPQHGGRREFCPTHIKLKGDVE